MGIPTTCVLIGTAAQDDPCRRAAEQRYTHLVLPTTIEEALDVVQPGHPVTAVVVDVDSVVGSLWLSMLATHVDRPLPVVVLSRDELEADDPLSAMRFRVVVRVPASETVLLDALDQLAAMAQHAFREGAAALVGHMSLLEIERALRAILVEEALAQCAGNVSAAARVLKTPRMVVQRELKDPGRSRGRERSRTQSHVN